MFTGIIEDIGKIGSLGRSGDKLTITVGSRLAPDLKIGDSVSVNGVCLTVTDKTSRYFRADIVPETSGVSTLGSFKVGEEVNLERAMPSDGRFNGHIVSGHVDARSLITNIVKNGAAFEIEIALPRDLSKYIVYKGSVCLDGVSLTVAHVDGSHFGVAVIPHSALNTTLYKKRIGDSGEPGIRRPCKIRREFFQEQGASADSQCDEGHADRRRFP